MTIDELVALLETIPATGAINMATRQAIREQIYALQLAQEQAGEE